MASCRKLKPELNVGLELVSGATEFEVGPLLDMLTAFEADAEPDGPLTTLILAAFEPDCCCCCLALACAWWAAWMFIRSKSPLVKLFCIKLASWKSGCFVFIYASSICTKCSTIWLVIGNRLRNNTVTTSTIFSCNLGNLIISCYNIQYFKVISNVLQPTTHFYPIVLFPLLSAAYCSHCCCCCCC